MNESVLGKVVAVGIAIAFLLSVAFAFIGETVTTWICGTAPQADHLFSGFWLALTGQADVYKASGTCALPVSLSAEASRSSFGTAATGTQTARSSPIFECARGSRQQPTSARTSQRRLPFAVRSSCGPISHTRRPPMSPGGSERHAAWTCSYPSKTP